MRWDEWKWERGWVRIFSIRPVKYRLIFKGRKHLHRSYSARVAALKLQTNARRPAERPALGRRPRASELLLPRRPSPHGYDFHKKFESGVKIEKITYSKLKGLFEPRMDTDSCEYARIDAWGLQTDGRENTD